MFYKDAKWKVGILISKMLAVQWVYGYWQHHFDTILKQLSSWMTAPTQVHSTHHCLSWVHWDIFGIF